MKCRNCESKRVVADFSLLLIGYYITCLDCKAKYTISRTEYELSEGD